MSYTTVFKRYELKYLLTRKERELVLAGMAPFMELDGYGRTVIRNVYYDTDTYRLIRHSIEKPPFKEKLRLRSYERAEAGSTVFVELKRKYHHTVYKRRVPLAEADAVAWLAGAGPPDLTGQIIREVDYFLSYYETLAPRVFLSYEREAYRMEGSDFRVTFDENILARREALSLCEEVGGTPLLPEDAVLMELKCSGGIPLFMTSLLTRYAIRRASFSKYGVAYTKLIYNQTEDTTYGKPVSRTF